MQRRHGLQERLAGKRLRLLESAEQVAKLGSWEWLPRTDEQFWSDNLYRLFGLEVDELVPTRAFVLEQTHPDDRERVARYVEMTRQDPRPPPIEYRIMLPGRTVRYLRSTITTTESDARGATRIVGTVQDVTEQHLAGREIAAHAAVSGALVDWESLANSCKRLLSELAEAIEAVFGALWVPEGDVLVPHESWAIPHFRARASLSLRPLRSHSAYRGASGCRG